MESPPTRDALLDAAEELFAERGFDGTSLRAVTRYAGANLAAVHYHFGSKEELVQAVLRRRLEPLAAERLGRLSACEESAAEAGRPPELEGVVRAFVAPLLEQGCCGAGSNTFGRLMSQVLTEPGGMVRQLLAEELRETFERFTSALGHALPQLAEEELIDRFYFMVGAMVHSVGGFHLPDPGRRGATDPQARVDRLVRFLAAGFAVPAAGNGEGAAGETAADEEPVEVAG